MSVAYIGTSTFTLQRVTRGEPHFGLKTRQYEFRGAPSHLAAFLAARPTGSVYEGGYIIARDVDEGGPYDAVRLTVAYAPNFNDYVATNSISIKTSSKSAEINNASVYKRIAGTLPSDGDPLVSATREATYYSTETTYRYYASTCPTGARFNTLQVAANTKIIKSRITAQAGSASANFGAAAPPALVSALHMSVVVRVINHQAERIPGTPWWECTDVVAAELQGD